MYWPGHVGIGLIAYAPLAGAVLAAGQPELAALGALLAVLFSTLPDADQLLPIPHRGPTHTVAFALGVGVVVAVVAALVVPAVALAPSWTPAFVGTVVFVTLCSHIAGDAITPMGIRPFSPLSEFHYTMDLTPAKNARANRLFLTLGVVTLGAVIAIVP